MTQQVIPQFALLLSVVTKLYQVEHSQFNFQQQTQVTQ
jgi:hypothetical protein